MSTTCCLLDSSVVPQLPELILWTFSWTNFSFYGSEPQKSSPSHTSATRHFPSQSLTRRSFSTRSPPHPGPNLTKCRKLVCGSRKLRHWNNPKQIIQFHHECRILPHFCRILRHFVQTVAKERHFCRFWLVENWLSIQVSEKEYVLCFLLIIRSGLQLLAQQN